MFIFKGFESLKKWWEERNVIYFGKALRRKIGGKKRKEPKTYSDGFLVTRYLLEV